MKKVCKSCDLEKEIKNSHFQLCFLCNEKRLSKNKKEKVKLDNNYFTKVFVKPKGKLEKIKEDEDFYEKCFNLSEHKCEECNCELPHNFRDDNGKVIARWRYSHIIPKSIAPELRHDLKNINHLCMKHHMQWENGDKENMRIYNKNKLLYSGFLK